MTVEQKLQRVNEKIASACHEAGRAPESVQLIAVSKTRSVEAIEEARACGQIHFGENYAQELRDKAKMIPSAPEQRWHYIGRIQKNKAKYIAPNAYRIHTLENVEQAEALLKRAPNGIDTLIAVNIGRESQKSGVAPEHIIEISQQLAQNPLCRIHGLMCLPPMVTNPEDTQPYFEEMRYWLEKGRSSGFDWRELSMGMSADFSVAIANGATWVRVGTAIFGPRA